jgi:hypothetical protein
MFEVASGSLPRIKWEPIQSVSGVIEATAATVFTIAGCRTSSLRMVACQETDPARVIPGQSRALPFGQITTVWHNGVERDGNLRRMAARVDRPT